MSALTFELPARLEADRPPAARDGVRLLVASRSDGRIVHSRFRGLPHFLAPGDLLVLNTSATLPAALPVTRADGTSSSCGSRRRRPAWTPSAAGSWSCARATRRSRLPRSARS